MVLIIMGKYVGGWGRGGGVMVNIERGSKERKDEEMNDRRNPAREREPCVPAEVSGTVEEDRQLAGKIRFYIVGCGGASGVD